MHAEFDKLFLDRLAQASATVDALAKVLGDDAPAVVDGRAGIEGLRLEYDVKVEDMRGKIRWYVAKKAEHEATIRDLRAQLKATGGGTPAPAPKPSRYPLRDGFDLEKLPPMTQSALKTLLKWERDPKRQPNIEAAVNQPAVGLKGFRDIQRGIHPVRVRALLGDMDAVVVFARQMLKLVALAKTGYDVAPKGYLVKASPSREQEGVRRFNIHAYDGAWGDSAGSDDHDLDRNLTYGTLTEAEDLLYECRHFHPEIMAAWKALTELLYVDLAVRCVYLTTSRYGGDAPLWRRVHGVAHAQVAMAYFFRVAAKRYGQEPWLLEAARKLGAAWKVTRVDPDEFREVYEVMRDGIHADWDRIKGPGGKFQITFPHGNQRHYLSIGAKDQAKELQAHHFTVYFPESWQRLFADFLSGGDLVTAQDLEMMANTIDNSIHIDGWDSGLTSDDIGGGGLQDPAEEAKGASNFREVRFRQGGSEPSRWHLSDRNTDYGDSRGALASSGRGMFHSGMVFSTNPDRLSLIDQADKKLGQEHRVGLDVARLLCCAVDEGLVRF